LGTVTLFTVYSQVYEVIPGKGYDVRVGKNVGIQPLAPTSPISIEFQQD